MSYHASKYGQFRVIEYNKFRYEMIKIPKKPYQNQNNIDMWRIKQFGAFDGRKAQNAYTST